MNYGMKSMAGAACALLIWLAPTSARAAETIPAGTPISVRLMSRIDSSSAGPNQVYLASVANPVVAGNEVVIPRGANATVQLVKTGSGQYAVKLYQVSVNGRPYDVASSLAQVNTSVNRGTTARRGLIGGGVGAAIGGIAGGGTGAAIGAGAGGGLGAASGAASGRTVQLAPETLLSFQLSAPLVVAG